MLTWSRVLDRIREELCLPYHVLEKSDKDIISYLKEFTLPKFEDYYPDSYKLAIDCNDITNKVTTKKNEYYIHDPDDRSIFDITDIAFERSSQILFGDRPIGPFGFDQVPDRLLGNFLANNTRVFSDFSYIHEFIHPNIVRISPQCTENIVVMYDRTHDPELSSVSRVSEQMFIELCLGMFMKNIGRIRTRYSNIQTAFGEITLNGEDIKNEGTEIYNTALEDLKKSTLTDIMMDRG